MQKVIQENKGLNSSQELQDLIHCAESAVDTESDEDGESSRAVFPTLIEICVLGGRSRLVHEQAETQ
ncbi:ectonucleotide pyrophosphatase phosphodiesterase family member 2 [Clarias magur]|uniref:Ectonucleotide pyrophosphatase phosphodiesterase family member 2 n=1 Tax=Clarias magur TaxID=1594786 RepID=A0A8J4TT30_CLAMG|nr:ectonucleotide pyrophosphatase phosphodiesterase family member 2 [Clarias magur]